jgi:hypothetical protein
VFLTAAVRADPAEASRSLLDAPAFIAIPPPS